MIVFDDPQGSEGWRRARAGKVTASRASDVMAKGRNGAPSLTRSAYLAELIAETLTGEPVNSFKGNADTERGILLEPDARLAYEIATGETVRQVGLIRHPFIARAAASPDGLIGELGGLEVKCPKPHVHLDYLLSGTPPSAYQPQMAMQAMCAELAWVDFVSYCPVFPEDLRLFVVRFTPTFEYLKEVEGAVVEFLEELDAKMEKVVRLRGAAC